MLSCNFRTPDGGRLRLRLWRFGDYFEQPGAQAAERGGVNLRDARFADAQYFPHFLHGELLEMIESQHLPLAGRQFRNRQLKQRVHFRPKRLLVGIVLFRSGLGIWRFAGMVFRSGLKALDIQATEIAAKVLKVIEAYFKLSRNFGLAGVAAQPRLAPRDRLLQPPRLTAQRPRTPIHEPEAIQNRAADAEFGVVFQLNIFAWIVLSHRIHQSENAGVNEILEQNLGRQTSVNAARNVLNVRKVIEEQLLALVFIEQRCVHIRVDMHGWFQERPNKIRIL